MPRRYPEPSAKIGDTKTSRSHEMNQERAYIAASRRSDRSLEARVNSARMASDIHKQRTGRGFKITPEIVLKEEMYEEEEDELPRQYRLMQNNLAHMRTGNPEMDYRMLSYCATTIDVAMQHEKNVHDEFEKAFPWLAKSRSSSQSFPQQSLPAGGLPIPPGSPTAQLQPSDATVPISPVQQHMPGPTFNMAMLSGAANGMADRQTSLNGSLSPPDLTPGSTNSSGAGSVQSPVSTATNCFSPVATTIDGGFQPMTSAAPLVDSSSCFTAQLPPQLEQMFYNPSEHNPDDFVYNFTHDDHDFNDFSTHDFHQNDYGQGYHQSDEMDDSLGDMGQYLNLEGSSTGA